MPKVSVVMSTYNRADTFLPKAVQSVIDQTFTDWELIIVDDHSTDSTKEVVESFDDDRIRYIRLDENFGSDTRPKNEGILAAEADYIAFLDDDVNYRPNHLELLYNETNRHDVVYSDMWIETYNQPGIAYDHDAQLLLLRNYIDTSSVLIKKEALMYVGGFDETLKKFVDWNLWVRISKAGFSFKRVPKLTFNYTIHEDTKSQRVKTETYNHPKLGVLFTPTFDPSGCYIRLPYLGEIDEPKVAVFTIHYNRLDYSKRTYEGMVSSTQYLFDWFNYDNGTDGTKDWLKDKCYLCMDSGGRNMGISHSSNQLVRHIVNRDYDIVIKIDNDVEFQTHGWLEDIVDMWKRNHMIYVSPYVEGLYHNPGGAPRRGYGMIGDQFIEVTNHIGGIFAAVSAKAYEDFRWTDEMLHGNQDVEASHAFRLKGYMPCYYPKHRITHMDGTIGQQIKHKDYFEKRKYEKTHST